MTSYYEITGQLHGPNHHPQGIDPVFGVVPVGTGVWWWGSAAKVPPGWKVVDGTVAVNGSAPPDMRDKMPIAAGTTYALGDTGGSASQAAHTDHPAHSDHSSLSLSHDHAHDDPVNHISGNLDHDHDIDFTHNVTQVEIQSGTGALAILAVSNHNQNTSTDSPGSQIHDGGGVDPGGPGALAHSAHGSHSAHGTNLPPYVAWHFIVRVR